MKKLSLLMASMIMLLFSVSQVNAQDEEISDENLYNYALMMEVVESMKKEISAKTNEMIKNQEGMTGQRYLELAKTGGDEAKLTEAEAKDFEKQFLELVTNMQDEHKSAISEVLNILANKMINGGAKNYKAIRDALGSDADVKARYEAIQQQIASAAEAGA